MAEEIPLLSDSSFLELASSLSYEQPTLSLCPPEEQSFDSPITLKEVLCEVQESQFPQEKSSIDAKFSLENGFVADDEARNEKLEGEIESVDQDSEKLLFLDGDSDFAEFESEKKIVNFEENEAIADDESMNEIFVGFAEFESEKKNVNFEKNEAIADDNEIIVGKSEFVVQDSEKLLFPDGNSDFAEFESVKKNGECLKLKYGVGLLEEYSENKSVADKIGNEISEQDGELEVLGFELKKKNEHFEGFLPKLVKNECEDSNGNALTCSLNIEVIDGTAIIDVSKIDVKKNKRRGKKGKSNQIGISGGVSNRGKRKFMYSRKEMEALRFVHVKGQKEFWKEIYNGFLDTVKKEYDELGNFRHHKQGGSTFDHHQTAGKRDFYDRGILGESCSGNLSCDEEILSSTAFTCDGNNSGKDGDDLVEEWGEDEDSEDEYESIQRRAFLVEGEPDFESGSPEDGLEYLRRVRWEAAHIPKVTVAKLDRSKLNKEQSVYMPKIPDIETCPEHLVPLKQWEDEFTDDFSELRLALSQLGDTGDTMDMNSDSIIFGHKGRTSPSSHNPASLKLPSGGPTLSTVLEMDPVTRVTMLKKRISLFDSTSDLSKDDYAWLFALCAVVHTPLDADTCASLRCLLRRCAKLRAAKSELDDEVVMLNVLATISGKYFGQSEY